ncbi:MAG: ATP-dependent DNA helicase RecG [Actinomycetota bacterium]|nr:ATP-dependent DNA helicase RecG [Actinomycetota bacterium]
MNCSVPEKDGENLNVFSYPVRVLPGVGQALEQKLKGLGLSTIGELLFHFPRRYFDRSSITPIGQVKTGQEVTVLGKVRDLDSKVIRGRKNMLRVTIFDGTGYLEGVWFNQEYHKERLKTGTEVAFSGKVGYRFNSLQIVNPSYDILEYPSESGKGTAREAIHTGRIVPIYPETQGLTSAMLRRIVRVALDYLREERDYIPPSIRDEFELMPLLEALHEIHFPRGSETLKRARFRALFDEIFIMQVGLALIRKRREREGGGIQHKAEGNLPRRLIENLGMELTGAQKRALREIYRDMRKPYQMNRLLQGEVGSGKTLVSLLALLLSVESGFQGAIMAPTEILANQHYTRISKMLKGFRVKVALLTSASPESVLDGISDGSVDIVIGTHSLIQEKVSFSHLGLAVVDEQHRFGLEQRVALVSKGRRPDILYMSATPIPRTLALTLYGDLDVSVIDEIPSGMKGTDTVVARPGERKGAIALVGREVSAGRQAFVICPLIEESDTLEAKAASDEVERLRKELPESRIGLLHGQMKSAEKKAVMERFEARELDLLVSTSMLEVGIDVPNTTVMIIENADRFGLAQLHQLRGRVGRGDKRGVCILFADPKTEEAKERMEAIRKYSDGFSLAEADLRIRGEGSIFGTRQSGIPDLRLARLTRDFRLIEKARRAASKLVESDPELLSSENIPLRIETARRFSGTLSWLFKG